MDNYVGKRLDGRYEIQEIVGGGGMSVVYKAYDNVDDRVVAVKILKDEFLTNDDFVRRFKNESKAIALLSHPNIVKVYDVSFGEKHQEVRERRYEKQVCHLQLAPLHRTAGRHVEIRPENVFVHDEHAEVIQQKHPEADYGSRHSRVLAV